MVAYCDHVKLFTDGGSHGNPGPGAIGIVVIDASSQELETYSQCIGHTTNNQAEYRAVIKGLNICAKHTRHRVTCFSDSALLVNQMSGVWRLKNEQLRDLFHEVKRCEEVFREVVYTHVKRPNPYIRQADRLVNEALEGR